MEYVTATSDMASAIYNVLHTTIIPSVFCSCHCSSFPITLHLYYTSARGYQQGCRCLGTFCLEVRITKNACATQSHASA